MCCRPEEKLILTARQNMEPAEERFSKAIRDTVKAFEKNSIYEPGSLTGPIWWFQSNPHLLMQRDASKRGGMQIPTTYANNTMTVA